MAAVICTLDNHLAWNYDLNSHVQRKTLHKFERMADFLRFQVVHADNKFENFSTSPLQRNLHMNSGCTVALGLKSWSTDSTTVGNALL